MLIKYFDEILLNRSRALRGTAGNCSTFPDSALFMNFSHQHPAQIYLTLQYCWGCRNRMWSRNILVFIFFDRAQRHMILSYYTALPLAPTASYVMKRPHRLQTALIHDFALAMIASSQFRFDILEIALLVECRLTYPNAVREVWRRDNVEYVTGFCQLF